MRTMLFKNAGQLPKGRVFSTARKGGKWYGYLRGGEVLRLVDTDTGEHLGNAAVVDTDLMPLMDLLEDASGNHAIMTELETRYRSGQDPRFDHSEYLLQVLNRTYGPLNPDDEFSKVYMIILHGATFVV